jgi:hypothetical protein
MRIFQLSIEPMSHADDEDSHEEENAVQFKEQNTNTEE